jgi:D-3-phosphoglycerate dehydrogenase
MHKVYITDYVENPDIERKILGKELSIELHSDIEALIVWHQKIDGDYLDKLPKIKGIVRYGVGYDTIDLEEIRKRGLVFCNTPDYGTEEVSDTAIAMLMSIVRGVHDYDFNSRKFFDNWQENTLSHIHRTSELKLGVIGAGRIGTALMRKASAIGFKVFFYDPYVQPGYEKAIGVNRYEELVDLLHFSDVVSIHTPLTSETKGMVDLNFVSSMKEGASLINTARGEIISNLDILYDAIESNKIYAIGLDVLPEEPPSECKLISQWRQHKPLSSRVIINPHASYFSQESYVEMRTKAAKNAKRILDGIEPINIIVDGR